MPPVSKAQQKATQRYVSKNYDRHMLTMPKGNKATLQEHAAKTGESVNAFVLRAVREQIERDNV